MKSLVLCYSLSGRTALVGKAIAETIGGEFELVEEQEGRSGFMGMARGLYQALTDAKTAIQRIKADAQAYDRIVIGTPVWGGKPAPAVNMLMEMIPLKGKTVDVFVTMGGKSPGVTLKRLAQLIRDKEGKLADAVAIRTGGVPNEELIKGGRAFGEGLKKV